MPDVLFVCEGDRVHGMGHVVRCLTLERFLSERGIGVEFATPAMTPGWNRVLGAPYPIHDLRSDRVLDMPRCDAVILDLENGPTRNQLEAVRPWYRHVITLGGGGYRIAEPEAINRLVDLQVYQSVLTDSLNGANVLRGTEWLIINPEYAACQPDYTSGHVVVTMGGSDPHNLTGKAIDLLARIGRRVKVVIGPAAQMLRDTVVPLTTDVVVAPDSLGWFFDGAALTVCALGMTAYESLAAGVPVILTNWTADHERTALELERRGIAWNTGTWDQFETSNLRERVTLLLDDPGLLRRMGEKGRKLVDGKGAGRVAEEICKLITA